MRMRSVSLASALALAWLASTTPACAQQPPATAAGDTQKQLDALRAQVSAMQKDLDEIKALLAPLRQRQPQPPTDMVIDLGNRPVKGDPSARLTLIELTDYQ